MFTLDEKFFDVIDTEEKAYILGFIYADGNISDFSREKHYRLRITLRDYDIELLEKIKTNLRFTGAIKTRQLKSNIRNTEGYFISELSISNKHLIYSLVDKGVYPNKTDKILFPNISPNLYRHFIRGFFDGDGSIYKRDDRPNGIRIELGCASLDFLNSIVAIIKKELNLDLVIRTRKYKNDYYVFQTTQQKARLIIDWLYKNSNIYLQRKFNLYRKLIAPLFSDR